MTDPSDAKKPIDPTNEPFEVEAGDREVRIGAPWDGEVTLTADAAEISGLRLLDAADRSRRGR